MHGQIERRRYDFPFLSTLQTRKLLPPARTSGIKNTLARRSCTIDFLTIETRHLPSSSNISQVLPPSDLPSISFFYVPLPSSPTYFTLVSRSSFFLRPLTTLLFSFFSLQMKISRIFLWCSDKSKVSFLSTRIFVSHTVIRWVILRWKRNFSKGEFFK